MEIPTQLESFCQSLSSDILEHVTEALRGLSSIDGLNRPVLRFELFLDDAVDDGGNDSHGSKHDVVPATRRPLISKRLDLSGARASVEELPVPPAPTAPLVPAAPLPPPAPSPSPSTKPEHLSPSPTLCASEPPSPRSDSPSESYPRRKGIGGLRPARPEITVIDGVDSQRQMQVPARSFPKRMKVDDDAVATLREASLDKFIVGIWEQIYGGIDLDPQSILEQWQAAASAATTADVPAPRAISDHTTGHNPSSFGLLPAAAGPAEVSGSFNQSNSFCRRVTQASRTCRSIEVVVQARWIEHFEAYVETVASSNPSLSTKKCRKAALLEACHDFGWTEKDMRNRMRIWAGYKEIKDAGGWAALVFAGMGIYRFCKYRIGFDGESTAQRLQALRPRLEVAADTLHPSWRRLLGVVGEPCAPRFVGHPHDWVVFPSYGGGGGGGGGGGSDEPVPLRATYLGRDPGFSFEHLDESVVDVRAWGGDDPRWVPPPITTAGPGVVTFTCRSCGQQQSDDAKLNGCYCFPVLFGGPRAATPVQVFRTSNGRNNGLQALTPFDRGMAVGEFVGFVTNGLQDVDVFNSSTASHPYQIWQGRQGNYTRFVNHSCRPNAQFQSFVWMSTERIVLVSKGIGAGEEITVDYSESYWRGLDKECLCGESCCRYRTGGV
ncbi:SET domain-containing protein [Chaetomium fimeti]|uniref:SET domain-containing protein n=1 Tax=Chaetomium fimeti TaxID=1854472 RepID=A0AAE0HN02_9PEZI|nr:SET domain-containing protein [Chaetomium fimeti]